MYLPIVESWPICCVAIRLLLRSQGAVIWASLLFGEVGEGLEFGVGSDEGLEFGVGSGAGLEFVVGSGAGLEFGAGLECCRGLDFGEALECGWLLLARMELRSIM